MSVINETLKVLDKIDDVTDRLLGMHIGDGKDGLYQNFNGFINRPLGLYAKSHDFMVENVTRNAGNGYFSYDGYGIPIGEMSNPYFNTYHRAARFITDPVRRMTSNYLDHFRMVYGANLSVENINYPHSFAISNFAARVGRVDTSYVKDALYNPSQVVLGFSRNAEGKINGIEFQEYDDGNGKAITNPNSFDTDTELGWVNGYHLINTLRNSIVENDLHKTYQYSITENLGNAFGLNTNAVINNNVLDISYRRSTENGRFEGLSPLEGYSSPVYNSNYGNYEDLGIYKDYYNSTPSKTTRKFIFDNVSKNRYRPTIEEGDKGETYLNNLLSWKEKKSDGTTIDGKGVDFDTSLVDGLSIRYKFTTAPLHSNIAGEGILNTYGEHEGNGPRDINFTANRGIRFGITNTYSNTLTSDDLLKKTNDAFKNGKYDTLISRFKSGPDAVGENDIKETAYTKEYGLSHGRNLLKKNTKDDVNGYNNPYCRVWTHHHQYNRLMDAIRPFSEDDNSIVTQGELFDRYNFSEFSASARDGFGNGRQRLGEYGVINQKNGLVNITPIEGPAENKVDIKNCMFSIENLAWRDVSGINNKAYQVGGLSPEQKGPNGGRIMWFPPYDISFNESTNAQWNETEFVGRGESIYTYRNTKRSGTLSFKLLIDHPSIIDYWEGKGKSKINSIINKDSELDDPEQQILRFFAGCDLLTASPQKNIPRVVNTTPSVLDEPQKTPETRVVSFFVFYPNDYSGMDDDPTNAITYLVNGLGSGYELQSNGNIVNLTPKIEKYYKKSVISTSGREQVGGYEIRFHDGVSLVKSPVCNETKAMTFASATTESGNTIKLALQIGPEDRRKPWWKRKWYYRCDKNKADEDLHKEKSYVDSRSASLNSLGTSEATTTILTNNPDVISENLYSLTDVFVALTDGNSKDVLNGYYDINRVNEFKKIVSEGNIEKIVCNGFASQDGGTAQKSENAKRNNELAEHRAKTVKDWLKKMGVTSKEWEVLHKKYVPFSGVTDVSSTQRKYERRARIDIHIKTEQTKLDVNTYTSGSQPSSSLSETYVVSQTQASNAYRADNYIPNYVDGVSNERFEDDYLVNHLNAQKRAESVRLAGNNIASLAMNLRNSVHDGNVNVNGIVYSIDRFSENAKSINNKLYAYDREIYRMGDNIARNNISDGYYDDRVDIDSDGNTMGSSNKTDNNTVKANRYDNESKFFELLEINEPVLHHKITDKIKYFDPAFHSMTPEGFNARLTFLQQCMRQGPTISASDNGSVTANNLSYGRPPVCVLRIGDFYNTKIIVNTLDIQYDPLVWDLNSEGIGVMPMIANVSIGFNFIGGSSLSGPISRLQNALSFNMYANTEVYDNRAELVEYDPSDGQTIKKYHPYYPNIENNI